MTTSVAWRSGVQRFGGLVRYAEAITVATPHRRNETVGEREERVNIEKIYACHSQSRAFSCHPDVGHSVAVGADGCEERRVANLRGRSRQHTLLAARSD